MSTTAKLNEYNHAEEPARRLLERLGWTYVPREALAAERGDEREVLLKARLKQALLWLNEWMTEEQAERVIFDLEHIDATGMARNQRVHEYLTYGMPLVVDTPQGRASRTVRFFDFDHPEGGLNEFVVTTQFRVRRGNERPSTGSGRTGELIEDDERMVIPDIVLFVNGIPLVVMEAKSPSLMGVWKSQAVRQLRRYQEAGPEWHGAGAPELFHYNLLVRGPLRRGCGLRRDQSAGERLLRMEIGAALLRGRGPAAVRRRAAGSGSAHRRASGSGDTARRAARLRGLRDGSGTAGKEAAPLPAIPSCARRGGAAAIGRQAG